MNDDLTFKPEINKKSEVMNRQNERVPIHLRSSDVIKKKEAWLQEQLEVKQQAEMEREKELQEDIERNWVGKPGARIDMKQFEN